MTLGTLKYVIAQRYVAVRKSTHLFFRSGNTVVNSVSYLYDAFQASGAQNGKINFRIGVV